MAYKILKSTPCHKNYMSEFETKKEARDYLSFVLKNYKESSLRGEKNKNYWASKNEIVVINGGDRASYEIVKA